MVDSKVRGRDIARRKTGKDDRGIETAGKVDGRRRDGDAPGADHLLRRLPEEACRGFGTRLQYVARNVVRVPQGFRRDIRCPGHKALATEKFANFVKAGFAVLDLVIAHQRGDETEIEAEAAPVQEGAEFEIRKDKGDAVKGGIEAGDG